MSQDTLRDPVRDHYADAARRAAAGKTTSCCGTGITISRLRKTSSIARLTSPIAGP